jgi:hypothetical protein
VNVREEASGAAKIVTYTIEYDRAGVVVNVILMLELADGARTIANAEDPVGMASNLLEQQPVGRTGTVQFDGAVARNLFSLDN